MPLQPPVLALSVSPPRAVPEMTGAVALTGGQLDCRDRQDGFEDADPASPSRIASEKATARVLAAKRGVMGFTERGAFPTSPQVADCIGFARLLLEENPSNEPRFPRLLARCERARR